jgi:DNA invertase Pin-like site-specific DNA recombinase
MIVTIYSRVFTKGKGQDTQNQILQLNKFCEINNYQIYKIYEDHESGSKGRKERASFDMMFKEARQRKFQMIVFWSLDRFSRESIFKTMMYLKQLDEYGIKFHSYTEEYLTTDNGLVSNVLLSVMNYFAKLEREKISERTKAGVERARSKGKTIGRPVKEKLKVNILELRKSNSFRRVAELLSISAGTVMKYSD